MQYRTKLTIAKIRKWNNFLDNCAKWSNSDSHARFLLAHKINRAKIGQTVLKG